MNILVDKSLCSSIIECQFLAVESVVQRRCTFLRLLIHIAKLPPGILNAYFKVSVSQYHWKLSFKRLFHTQHDFFFSFLDDPQLLFTAWPIYPGKNKRNKARDDRCWWPGVHMGGMETDNRKRVSLETISLLLPPSFLKQTAKDRILPNT